MFNFFKKKPVYYTEYNNNPEVRAAIAELHKKIAQSEAWKQDYNFTPPLSPEQIDSVIMWLNTWEQIKDTSIPIRFKEDFTR